MLFAAPLLILLSAAQEIACPGSYGGHLQGIATDEQRNIYWSFTVAIVKTDAQGALLAKVDAPTHQGDLAWHEGRVYVAVNLGKFNEEPGTADSWVYVYDDVTLELLEKRPLPEAVHGAGGIAWHEGAFVVVGGLPRGHEVNYVYRYDKSFSFIERRDIASGYTNMGIQTACVVGDELWLGTYHRDPALLVTDAAHGLIRREDVKAAYGIAAWDESHWLRGESGRGETKGTFTGKAIVTPRTVAMADAATIRAFGNRKATVLFFIDTACPIANQYAPKITALAEEYATKDVASFRVYPGDYASAEAIATHTRDYAYRLPAARDTDYALTREAEASVTPEAVVFDREGVVQYRGRIDNRYEELGKPRRQVTQEDLRDALDAMLAGKPVATPRTQAIGCYIEAPAAAVE